MEDFRFSENYFPRQKVSASEKGKAKWYANCIDYVIAKGVACNDMREYETRINVLHGNIPQKFYEKTLNPYNANKESLKRFPAVMRNLDIMTDIIRRYIGEYTKGVHEFNVGSNSPDIALNKDMKLKQEVTALCQQAFMQEFQRRMMEMQQQQQAQMQEQGSGGNQMQGSSTGGMQQPQQIDPNQVMTPEEIEQFVKNFNENYIDERTQQAEQLLQYIQDHTKDEEIYAEAYFNFVSFGRCFTYHDIRNRSIYKENVPIIEAYPIPNGEKYIEDQDMFARRIKMSRQQILDMFEEDMTKKDKEFFDRFYTHYGSGGNPVMLRYDQMFENYPDVCEKFSDNERDLFKKGDISINDVNGELYDVWHVVWKGYAKQGILTYINEQGIPDTQIVDESFKFDEHAGHINIEWVYTPQVYEGYRIGGRYNSIYPIKARAVMFNRDNKLPYNGILEPIPLMGEFSIVAAIAPYQIMRNIISYHREMVIAKNKLLILIMPESLVEDRFDDRIYRLAADGTLIYDDSIDSNSLKAQQIRLLNANMGDYIRQLTELIESIKLEAREMVDMTQQRYGQIATSAGKATTEEAIARGSMGSVTINFVFDKLRMADYQGDIDMAKLAYIDGLDDGYFDREGEHRIISLDVDSFLNSDYSVMVKNSQKETDKLEQLRQWAFSAAQNGDLDMALAAITGNSVNSMKLIINKFNEIKRQHEEQMQQAEQMLKQQEIEQKLQEIAAKGEEDRKTLELKYYYELQKAYVEADAAILDDSNSGDTYKDAANERIEAGRRDIERMKLDIEREKIAADNYNQAADRNLAREQMKNDLKIARTNKNKYDK